MLHVGDCAKHQTTGDFGKVVGYGHEVIDGAYLPTLIVRVRGMKASQGGFVEAVSSEWVRLEGEGILPFSATVIETALTARANNS